jgi:uncharacterized repeat protein (TIGR02543 family)
MSNDININESAILETLNAKIDYDGGNYKGSGLANYVVDKTGDTMTGSLISQQDSYYQFVAKSTVIDATATPASTQHVGIDFKDKNDVRLGWFGICHDKNGNTYANQVDVKNLTATNGATVTLKAIWDLKPFTITYILGDVQMAALGSSAPTSAKYNQTVTISNPTAPGFTFMGWTVSGTGASINGTTLTIGSSNVTLKAHFKTHILTYIDYMWNNARSANSLTNADPAGNKRYTGSNPNNYVKFNDESVI